jgi:hypothetical protein
MQQHLNPNLVSLLIIIAVTTTLMYRLLTIIAVATTLYVHAHYTTGGEYSPSTAAARRAIARQQRGGSGASDRDSSSSANNAHAHANAQLSESEQKVAAARSSGVSPQWRDIETVKKEKTAQLQRVRAQRCV